MSKFIHPQYENQQEDAEKRPSPLQQVIDYDEKIIKTFFPYDQVGKYPVRDDRCNQDPGIP